MHEATKHITDVILKAASEARDETRREPEASSSGPVQWPLQCTVGPGLEGAIACESKVGYVNGSKGKLSYRGYDIFDLCAHCCYEEVSYLLVHGSLPTGAELDDYRAKLAACRHLPDVMRMMMSFPVEEMNPMAALRLGTNLMRQRQTYIDDDQSHITTQPIGTDEDTDPMEIYLSGEAEATYQFNVRAHEPPERVDDELSGSEDESSCYHLIAGVTSIAAAITRLRAGHLPLEPDPQLSHAANLIYMMTGRRPTPNEERIMDVMLILHADHGMNASTFASLVVASTLSDIYFAVGAGIAALNGPLHGGANEQALKTFMEIGSPNNVEGFYH